MTGNSLSFISSSLSQKTVNKLTDKRALNKDCLTISFFAHFELLHFSLIFDKNRSKGKFCKRKGIKQKFQSIDRADLRTPIKNSNHNEESL